MVAREWFGPAQLDELKARLDMHKNGFVLFGGAVEDLKNIVLNLDARLKALEENRDGG